MKLSSILALACGLLFSAAQAWAGYSGTVTMTVKPGVTAGSKVVNLWLPYPVSDASQKISDMTVSGNHASSAVYTDPGSGAMFLHASWPAVSGQPELTMTFHVNLDSRRLAELRDSGEPIPAPIRAQYLRSTPEIPADLFRDQAEAIVTGKSSILDKARAIYDWTVENTFRDPEVKGCGLGKPGRTLSECKGGGKCADLSSIYVTMARAAGVPARDVYGLRQGTAKSGDMTGDYHCWAEFYLPGTGWVPVDPADVRKMMLVNKLELKDEATATWREFFWGGDDLFRITLNTDSRGVQLTPAQQGEPVSYFMYPFAQVDGQTLNYFDAKAFSYSVTYTAD